MCGVMAFHFFFFFLHDVHVCNNVKIVNKKI